MVEWPEGVRYKQEVSWRCPYIVDLEIDGRPAYFRFRWGILRLAFEDLAQETVSVELSEDMANHEVDEYVAKTLVPVLRAKVVREQEKLMSSSVYPDADSPAELVKDFLRWADDRKSYKLFDDSNYSDAFEADPTLVEWAIEEWNRQRGK